MKNLIRVATLSALLLPLALLAPKKEKAMDTRATLTITSSAIDASGEIARAYTCEDNEEYAQSKLNRSFPFSIAGLPPQAKYLSWIYEDPDAPDGTWVHWVVANVPVQNMIAQNFDVKAAGGVMGTNSWNKLSYGGPCPPQGRHRYYLYVFATDRKVNASASSTGQDLRAAVASHTVAEGVLLMTYQKKNTPKK